MGYEKVIFLDDEIDDNLKCAICFGVCEEATTACISGHTFCATCLQRADRGASNGGGKCPTCRADKINAANRPLRGMIDALRVRCAEGSKEDGSAPEKKKSRPEFTKSIFNIRTNGSSGGDDPAADDNNNHNNNLSGCEWEGKLGDWRDTHQKECLFVIVRCPDKCGKTLRRGDIDEHKKECSRRLVECDLCHQMMKYYMLGMHICPQQKVKCQYCQQEMTRVELGKKGFLPQEKFEGVDRTDKRTKVTGHYAVCPKVILACEFRKRGCMAEFKREDAAAHHAENAQFHAALVDETIDRLSKWDFVQMNWEIPHSKLTGSQNTVLRSKVVSGVSQYDLYLKLYLLGPGDPIKVAICSYSMSCCPVKASVSLKNVELEAADNEDFDYAISFAMINYEEEKRVEFQDGVAGVFEFSSALKRYNTDSDDENGIIERDYTRSDMLNSSVNNHNKVVIRAHFYISKQSKVLLSCDD